MTLSARRSRVGPGSVAASALVAFVASATLFVWKPDASAKPSTPAVALVNGTAITADDLDLRLAQILPLTSYHGRLAPDQRAAATAPPGPVLP